MFSIEDSVKSFVNFSEVILIVSVTGSKAFLKVSWKFCLPILPCNRKSSSWFFNEASYAKFFKSSQFLVANNMYVNPKKLRFRSTFYICAFVFITNTVSSLISLFRSINTNILIIFISCFSTWLFEFFITHIITTNISVYVLNIFYCLIKQIYFITIIPYSSFR